MGDSTLLFFPCAGSHSLFLQEMAEVQGGPIMPADPLDPHSSLHTALTWDLCVKRTKSQWAPCLPCMPHSPLCGIQMWLTACGLAWEYLKPQPCYVSLCHTTMYHFMQGLQSLKVLFHPQAGMANYTLQCPEVLEKRV